MGYIWVQNKLGYIRVGLVLDPSRPYRYKPSLAFPNCFGTATGTSNGNGILFTNSSIRLADVQDGASNTLLVGERGLASDLGWGWSMCGGSECEQYLSTFNGLGVPRNEITSDFTIPLYWSWHAGTCHFALADGSVHNLSVNMSRNTLLNLSTRAGGETIGEF